MKYISILALILLTACSISDTRQITQVIEVQVTATPRPTSTPSLTPPPTQTPSITPSPTATALPASISGNPRSRQVSQPEPVPGAYCGIVDTLDFPLDPPNGEDAVGGSDFGIYRDRYEKYHAGEDWGFRRGSNFGKPVYSTGHGVVTYAAPNGWGLDRGVVIIRHVFADGSSFLSFYGHLDPPSVTLTAGECVKRGEKVGEIGRPRTPPHLHFETRTHMAGSAGPGYWPSDPTEVGWLPPSQTIWEKRMGTSPGVLWTRVHVDGLTRSLGARADELIFIQGGQLNAVDPQDGSLHWSQPISDTVRSAVLDSSLPQVYLFDLQVGISAYTLSSPPEVDWTTKLSGLGTAELLPLPGGGVIAADRRRAVALNERGESLWEIETHAPVLSWAQVGDLLIFTTSDTETALWSADSNGATPWDWRISGNLVVDLDGVYLYGSEGLYRLDVAQRTGGLVSPLPGGNPQPGDVAPLANGGLILLHEDLHDRRLIALDSDGHLRWERSLRELPRGEGRLAIVGEQAYVLWSHTSLSGTQADLYAVDPENGDLTYLLIGGTRISYGRDTWLEAVGADLLFIHVGEGPLAMFDPSAALAADSP